MRLSHAFLSPALLVVALLVASAGAGTNGARADDATPTAGITGTPAPQPETPTIIVELPTAVPTSPPPAVSQEGGTPIATVYVPPPVATEPAPAPRSSDVLPTQLPRPTATPSPVVIITSPAPVAPEAPLPSPAQLQASARLRFGHGIPSDVRQWAFLIVPAARKYHLNPMLIAAVMTMESGGDPLALSGADARGLMQVLHGPWDPKQNIDTGASMLSEFYREFGSWSLALAAYNAGPNAVLTFHGIPPYRETRDYVIVVSYLWDLYTNHRLGIHRKTQYRKTLTDLVHFKDQRKKVKALARVGQVKADPSFSCTGRGCDISTSAAQSAVTPSLDPFWPVGTTPDPLQQVDPLPLAP
jgi:hypothetical protein